MFVGVISFCANMMVPFAPEVCVWYSDVNTYYEIIEECKNDMETIVLDPKTKQIVTAKMFTQYKYAGPIMYNQFCIKDTEIINFFKENNLETSDVPETL
jgi:hypothetical protein